MPEKDQKYGLKRMFFKNQRSTPLALSLLMDLLALIRQHVKKVGLLK